MADSRQINETIVNVTCVPAERLECVILSDGLAVVSAGQQVVYYRALLKSAISETNHRIHTTEKTGIGESSYRAVWSSA